MPVIAHLWRFSMPVSITSRHVNIDENIEEYIRKKLPRFEKYTDKIQKLDIVLEKDGYNHKVEMRLKAGPTEVHANVKDPDLIRAIDMITDKVERQMEKKWGKLKNKKHAGGEAPRKKVARQTIEPEENPARTDAPVKSKREKRAPARGAGNGRNKLPLYVEGLHVRIFPARRLDTNPMSIEHAAEELYFTDENFLCFINEDNRQLNVLYRRKDGNFGLIEPVF
jgi:putative sigma-54 modulation protein